MNNKKMRKVFFLMPILLLVFFIYFKNNDKISKENSSDKPKANKKNILKGNEEEIISQKSSDEKNIVKENNSLIIFDKDGKIFYKNEISVSKNNSISLLDNLIGNKEEYPLKNIAEEQIKDKEIEVFVKKIEENREKNITVEEKIKKIESNEKIEELNKNESSEDVEKVKFYIDKINVKDVVVLEKEVSEIIKKYEKNELGIEEISQIIEELTNLYISSGYVSTRVTLAVPQNINSGTLNLEIINGKLEKINYGDNSFRDKTALFTSFYGLEGEILNLKDIEKGLAIMNSVASNNVIMNLVAGNELGYSILEIKNEKKNRVRFGMGYDNLGSESTGKGRGKFNIGMDNPLGINDFLGLAYTRGFNGKSDENYSDSLLLNYRVPFKEWTFMTTQELSDYKILIEGAKLSYDSEGKTFNQSYTLNKQIDYLKDMDENISVSLGLKNVNNYIQDVKLKNSSYKSAEASISYSANKGIENGSLDGSVKYSQSIDVGGYSEVDKNFKAINLDFSLGKLYRKEKIGLIYTLSGQSQLVLKDVEERNEFSLGDENTMRGYKFDTYDGDRGLILSNTLSFVPVTENKVLQGMQVFTGLDYGTAYNLEDRDSEHLLGASIGIKWNYKKTNISLTYAREIIKLNEDNEYEIYGIFSTEF